MCWTRIFHKRFKKLAKRLKKGLSPRKTTNKGDLPKFNDDALSQTSEPWDRIDLRLSYNCINDSTSISSSSSELSYTPQELPTHYLSLQKEVKQLREKMRVAEQDAKASFHILDEYKREIEELREKLKDSESSDHHQRNFADLEASVRKTDLILNMTQKLQDQEAQVHFLSQQVQELQTQKPQTVTRAVQTSPEAPCEESTRATHQQRLSQPAATSPSRRTDELPHDRCIQEANSPIDQVTVPPHQQTDASPRQQLKVGSRAPHDQPIQEVTHDQSDQVTEPPHQQIGVSPRQQIDALPRQQLKVGSRVLQVGEQMGQGGMAEAIRVSDGTKDLVLKRWIDSTVGNQGGMESKNLYRLAMKNEARMMRMVQQHPNVIKILDVVRVPEFEGILMDLCSLGSVLELIKASKPCPVPLTWSQMWYALGGLASALAFCHSKGVVHKDIKAENVFVDLNPNQPDQIIFKLGDFGLAVKQDGLPGSTFKTRAYGTPGWMAPELIYHGKPRDGDITNKYDVFSFGIFMWEVTTACKFIPGASHTRGSIKKMTSGPPCPHAWRELMTRCLQNTPEDRPSFANIVKTINKTTTKVRQRDDELWETLVPTAEVER